MIPISKPTIGKEEIQAIKRVLLSRQLSTGKITAEFENEFTKFCSCKYAVATNNGTSALHTALYAIGIKAGDEVITTPFTFVATANSILMIQAKPVFVDINPKTYNIDSSAIDKAITKKTKAIIVVNLYGQTVDFNEINKIAKKKNLIVVEDAAQSVGATYNGKKSGNLADISCFSFYATKNITSGEGGILSTNNKNYYLKAMQFVNHGQKIGKSYEYVDLGYNYRMTNMQASILLEQLKKIGLITNKRQKIAQKYTRGLEMLKGIICPSVETGRNHVFHQFTIRVTKDFAFNRNKLLNKLQTEGIQTKVYYPNLLYNFPHFKKTSRWQNCKNAEKAAKEVLSLPIYPNLTSADLNHVINTIKKCYNPN